MLACTPLHRTRTIQTIHKSSFYLNRKNGFQGWFAWKENEMNQVKVFIDGSCLSNGSTNARCGLGVFYVDAEGEEHCFSKKITGDKMTNNVAELCAIRYALDLIEETGDKKSRYTLYSDSQYSIKCVTVWCNKWIRNNWCTAKGDPVKNKDLIRETVKKLKKATNVSLVYVKAHQDSSTDPLHIGNNRADELARQAAMSEEDGENCMRRDEQDDALVENYIARCIHDDDDGVSGLFNKKAGLMRELRGIMSRIEQVDREIERATRGATRGAETRTSVKTEEKESVNVKTVATEHQFLLR